MTYIITLIFKVCNTYLSHLRLKHGVDQNYVKNETVVKNRRKESVTKSNKKLKEKYDGW